MRNWETASNVLYCHNPNEYYINGEAKSAEKFIVLDISEGGPFYRDPYFEGFRLQFEHCVKEILQKFSINNRSEDIIDTYYNFRDDQLLETNQAMSHITDQHNHHIVVDVRAFVPGNIVVKSYHNMIQVEGDVERKNSPPKKFHRQFIIPSAYDMDTVLSVMSTDGVLTIVVPRTVRKDNTRIGHQKYEYATEVPHKRESTEYARRSMSPENRRPSPSPQSPPSTPHSSGGSRSSPSQNRYQDQTPQTREIKINSPQNSDSGRGTTSTSPSRRGSIGDGAAYESPKWTYRRNAHGGFWREMN